MKKATLVAVALAVLILVAAYFIPVTLQRQVFVANTFQNVIASVTTPQRWARWNNEVAKAWIRDSSACSFGHDSAGQESTINIPGKRIVVTALSYLLYRVEESGDGGKSMFTFSIIPYVGNGQPRSQHNCTIAYAQPTRMLFRWLPFLDRKPLAENILSELAAYLQNNRRFYGFPINIVQDTNTLFLTRKQSVPRADIFSAITALFGDIERVARETGCVPGFKNISFNAAGNDSVEILAGLNVDKVVEGHIGFVQMPSGQVLLTGQYAGPFGKRYMLYEAMEKYIVDHQLVKGGACFEKYLSPLPASDISEINIELSYPLRY